MNNIFTNFVWIMFVGPWGISLEMQIGYLKNTQELDNRYLDLVSYILESETANKVFGFIISSSMRLSVFPVGAGCVIRVKKSTKTGLESILS